MKVKRITLSIVGLTMVVALAACQAPPSAQQASQEYCQALVAYAGAVVGLHQIDSNSTIDQMKSAQQAVDQTYAALTSAAGQVTESRKNELKTATDNLSKAVNDISASMTVNEAVASIQDELAAVDAAIAAVNDEVKCSLPTPAPVPTATTSPVSAGQAQLCTDIAAYQQAVTDLDSLSGDSTIEQVEAAQKAVDAAWETAVQSAQQMPEIKVDALDAATKNLSKAVNDIESSMTFAQAKESIQDEIAAVQAARQDLTTRATCTP